MEGEGGREGGGGRWREEVEEVKGGGRWGWEMKGGGRERGRRGMRNEEGNE